MKSNIRISKAYNRESINIQRIEHWVQIEWASSERLRIGCRKDLSTVEH